MAAVCRDLLRGGPGALAEAKALVGMVASTPAGDVGERTAEWIARLRAGEATDDLEALEAKVKVWEEDNPMLGLRGVRLGLMMPGLYEMQVEAAIDAVVDRLRAGAGGLSLSTPLAPL